MAYRYWYYLFYTGTIIHNIGIIYSTTASTTSNKVNANSGPGPVIQIVGQDLKYKYKLRRQQGRYMENSGVGLVRKLQARAGKHQLGARAVKYKYGARTGKYRYREMTMFYKFLFTFLRPETDSRKWFIEKQWVFSHMFTHSKWTIFLMKNMGNFWRALELKCSGLRLFKSCPYWILYISRKFSSIYFTALFYRIAFTACFFTF